MKNSKGKVYYGMHFYPGVAEYQEPGKDPYRVFLNEDTLRSMDPTFAGRPIYVNHVDEVNEDIDEVRKDADGWVVESFFNAADGKHWVKFLVVSERAERAIESGMRLSNAYIPTGFSNGGLWNGVTYAKQVTSGEFEHLAIVNNPRYEESVILSPGEFKAYNDNLLVELKRLANSKDKGDRNMGLKLFKRAKVENEKAIDLEEMCVVLPKSGKEYSILQLVNAMDQKEMDRNSGLADMSHKVKMHDGSHCNVGEMMDKYKSLNDELEEMKKKKMDSDSEIEEGSKEVGDRGGDSALDNADDDEGAEDESMDNELEEDEEAEQGLAGEKKRNELAAAKKAKDKTKADRLRNAHTRAAAESDEVAVVDFGATQVQRGKDLY